MNADERRYARWGKVFTNEMSKHEKENGIQVAVIRGYLRSSAFICGFFFVTYGYRSFHH